MVMVSWLWRLGRFATCAPPAGLWVRARAALLASLPPLLCPHWGKRAEAADAWMLAPERRDAGWLCRGGRGE